mgnify:FL=1
MHGRRLEIVIGLARLLPSSNCDVAREPNPAAQPAAGSP